MFQQDTRVEYQRSRNNRNQEDKEYMQNYFLGENSNQSNRISLLRLDCYIHDQLNKQYTVIDQKNSEFQQNKGYKLHHPNQHKFLLGK